MKKPVLFFKKQNRKSLKLIQKIFILATLFFLKQTSAFSQLIIASFSPASGPVGTLVTIKGAGFDTKAARNIVYFGSVKAKVVTATKSSLKVIAPPGTSYERISVTTKNLTTHSSLP